MKSTFKRLRGAAISGAAAAAALPRIKLLRVIGMTLILLRRSPVGQAFSQQQS